MAAAIGPANRAADSGGLAGQHAGAGGNLPPGEGPYRSPSGFPGDDRAPIIADGGALVNRALAGTIRCADLETDAKRFFMGAARVFLGFETSSSRPFPVFGLTHIPLAPRWGAPFGARACRGVFRGRLRLRCARPLDPSNLDGSCRRRKQQALPPRHFWALSAPSVGSSCRAQAQRHH